MKKILCLVFCIAMFAPCFAIDFSGDDLVSIINLTPETVTRSKVTSLLGNPTRIEESKKTTSWVYTGENSGMRISWSKKSALLLKFSYSCAIDKKSALDNKLPHKLKSGSTDIAQAIKLLGTPNNVIIKEKTQEMHYSYQQKVLRLFFRDRVLVDYCLY